MKRSLVVLGTAIVSLAIFASVSTSLCVSTGKNSCSKLLDVCEQDLFPMCTYHEVTWCWEYWWGYGDVECLAWLTDRYCSCEKQGISWTWIFHDYDNSCSLEIVHP
jgi:hypothetical protein